MLRLRRRMAAPVATLDPPPPDDVPSAWRRPFDVEDDDDGLGENASDDEWPNDWRGPAAVSAIAAAVARPPPPERGQTEWAKMEDAAALVRREAALATRDARALVAELCVVAVALRQPRAATGMTADAAKTLALQALHVHVPLGELLRSTAVVQRTLGGGRRGNAKAQAVKELFSPQAFKSLVSEIEERASARLFPATYAALANDADRARQQLVATANDNRGEDAASDFLLALAPRDSSHEKKAAAAFAADARRKVADHVASLLEQARKPPAPQPESAATADVELDIAEELRRRGPPRKTRPPLEKLAWIALLRRLAFNDKTPSAAAFEALLHVESRVKSPASALRKLLRGSDAVRDVLGLRIIVDAPPQNGDGADGTDVLYVVLEAVRRIWPECAGRFKDYVAAPKPSKAASGQHTREQQTSRGPETRAARPPDRPSTVPRQTLGGPTGAVLIDSTSVLISPARSPSTLHGRSTPDGPSSLSTRRTLDGSY
ncbi:hypothetical protein M885DRAFT_42080 [Pelagophyceae sp. CCMP2097]|nr:hypothetical protein M885DRAFT_42080 [Pelagophyceae sp. CCMP2097]